MTRVDLMHCGKMPDAREELNRSMRIESRHSIKSLEGIGSSSRDRSRINNALRSVNCDTFK